MKLKMSNRDKKLIMYLGGILLPVLIYVFVFTRFQNGAADLRAENDILSRKVSDLEMLEEQQDYFENEIDAMKTRKAEIVKEFPAQVFQEDQIVFSRNLTSAAGMSVNQVTFGETEQFAILEDGDSYMAASRVPAGLSFQVSYDGLKRGLEYILNHEDRMTVQDMSVSYDNSTGNLSGTMNINMYAISGTDNTYSGPSVPGVPTGTPNIFQTLE